MGRGARSSEGGSMWLWVMIAAVVCLFLSSSAGGAVWLWYENKDDDDDADLTDAQRDVVKKVEAYISVSNMKSIGQLVINDLNKLSRIGKGAATTSKIDRESFIVVFILYVKSSMEAYESLNATWSGKIRIVKKDAFVKKATNGNKCVDKWKNRDNEGLFDYVVDEGCLGDNKGGLVWGNQMPYVPPIAADFNGLTLSRDFNLILNMQSPYLRRLAKKQVGYDMGNPVSILKVIYRGIVSVDNLKLAYEIGRAFRAKVDGLPQR